MRSRPTKLTIFWQSLIALALLIGQGSALAHEFAHDLHGEPESCVTCPVVKQLQHAATAPDHVSVPQVLPLHTPGPVVMLDIAPVRAPSKARAPPPYS